MNTSQLDLNLLRLFTALVEQRSVTRAADQIGLTQSATSAALGRLREALSDPLFVNVGREMRPTPRALQLIEPIQSVLETVEKDILQAQSFDPLTSERQFNILTPDIGEINLLPGLLKQIEHVAPRLTVIALSMPRHVATQALESGTADVAVGYFPDLQVSGHFQQRLFRNGHICLVRKEHSEIGTKFTMKQFVSASHVVVRPEGREHVFEQHLQKIGVSLRVKLRVSHFMSLLPIIEASDLVATVPMDIAKICSSHGDVRMVALPIASPMIDIHQFWHRRNHHDAAHIWLRAMIRDVFPKEQPSD